MISKWDNESNKTVVRRKYNFHLDLFNCVSQTESEVPVGIHFQDYSELKRNIKGMCFA